MKNKLLSCIEKYKSLCDYIDIRLENSSSTNIIITNGELATLKKSNEIGGIVRALYKGSWGTVSFNNLDDIDSFTETAIKQAKLIGNSESCLAPVEVVEDSVFLCLKNDPRKVSLYEKINLLKEYNELALNFHENISSVNVTYNEVFSNITFTSSEGSYIYQEKMDLGGIILITAVEGDNSQSTSVGFGSSDDYNCVLGLHEEIKKQSQIAVDLLKAPKVKAGTYTIITDSHLSGVFVHEAFGHLSEGDNVYENKELKDIMKLGKRFGRPILNIYDSGLDKGKRGYLKYDDEGVKTEKTYLIKEGKLVGRLHSRETAGKMNEKATGNGRAINYKYAPIPRMRNTVIESGNSSFKEMLKDISLGILAIGTNGGQTTGDNFTFSASYGYIIRNGKICELVRDINLTGNIFETLNNIDMIGNENTSRDSGGGCGKGEQFPLPVSFGGPRIRIQNVVVGGKE
ncbi:metalloprotease TldD [Clostridium tepidiprofundi DSM 19306]|uniref:Metalloprotease TldD n=1 Tax=Clostridium tepidiprofundi DSM 19306 TaxID=1121338 RepID=A0A151B252_9CLOT|nr:TldD/PmbA family protein [Clostridium tepidiprofundi]KYH33978.1 metalloprotease TldD [Clostridium tepidiprofundi DSM 19306]